MFGIVHDHAGGVDGGGEQEEGGTDGGGGGFFDYPEGSDANDQVEAGEDGGAPACAMVVGFDGTVEGHESGRFQAASGNQANEDGQRDGGRVWQCFWQPFSFAD